MTRPTFFIDETGNTYGRLTVVAPAGLDKKGGKRWLCACTCGTSKEVLGQQLRAGHTRSCGCLLKTDPIARTHGMTGHPAHRSWKAAHTRCTNPRTPGWHNYGGKGIKFLLPSFAEFWAVMGPTWFAGATLEREDGNKDYVFGNVKWATRKEQANNTTQNRNLTFKGETRNLRAWALHLGMNEETLRRRLSKHSVEDALGAPVQTQKRRVRKEIE